MMIIAMLHANNRGILPSDKPPRGGKPITMENLTDLDAKPVIVDIDAIQEFLLSARKGMLSWTLAAFGEELVWRGYLMNRVADFFKSSRRGWLISLIAVNIAFGFAHQYQGVTGVIENAIDGFLLGLIYLRCDRNLAVPIVAHGITDTIDFLLMFIGKYPGM